MKALFVTHSIETVLPLIKKAEGQWKNKGILWSVTQNHQMVSEYYDVVFLLGYRRIVEEETLRKVNGNVIVFHSSDLPKGRGWAPIYTAISSGYKYHTITMCYAAGEVDTGNILAKAKCRIKPNYTAPILRNIGRQIISFLIGKYISYFERKTYPGAAQRGKATYVSKRPPEKAEINITKKFKDCIAHLRASEQQHKAFFVLENEKYFIDIYPERKEIDTEFEIEEYFQGKKGKSYTVTGFLEPLL